MQTIIFARLLSDPLRSAGGRDVRKQLSWRKTHNELSIDFTAITELQYSYRFRQIERFVRLGTIKGGETGRVSRECVCTNCVVLWSVERRFLLSLWGSRHLFASHRRSFTVPEGTVETT